MEKTFSVNQRVIHCREGLSRIVAETIIGNAEYFVVQSDFESGEKMFVLKSRTENIIRPIMDVETAKQVITYMNSVQAEFMSNTKQRRDLYKKKLNSGIVEDLAFLTKQLYLFHYLNDHGTLVKLGPTDIEMLENADRVLFDELAITFDKKPEEIREFVKGIIDSL